MKKCGKCQIEKDAKSFCKNRSRWDGLSAWCRDCIKVYNDRPHRKQLRSGTNHNKYMKDWYKSRRKKYPWWGSYISIKQRCGDKTRNWYKRGIKCLITVDELKQIWFRDRAYLLKRPSLDRIDNDGHYIASNCRYIELSENARLGNIGKTRKVII